MFSMALLDGGRGGARSGVIGDMHGLNTLKHQPVKIATAIEGHWEENTPGRPTPLTLVGWRIWAERTRYALGSRRWAV